MQREKRDTKGAGKAELGDKTQRKRGVMQVAE